jgi:ectoine hydroxylase-related dioxygenase (phytanoyl-CoA dioxygenase family)
VVPGSHRRTVQHEPESPERIPSATRIEARAGDLVVIDPALLHASGRNHGAAARRLVVVGLCHARVSPACDHLGGLEPATRSRLPPAVRRLLSFPWDGDHAAWAVAPDGTVNGPRALEA